MDNCALCTDAVTPFSFCQVKTFCMSEMLTLIIRSTTLWSCSLENDILGMTRHFVLFFSLHSPFSSYSYFTFQHIFLMHRQFHLISFSEVDLLISLLFSKLHDWNVSVLHQLQDLWWWKRGASDSQVFTKHWPGWAPPEDVLFSPSEGPHLPGHRSHPGDTKCSGCWPGRYQS